MIRGRMSLPKSCEESGSSASAIRMGTSKLRVEQIDAHRRVHLPRMDARRLGLGWLFLETDDAPVLVGFDDAELSGGLGGIHLDGRDSHVRAGGDVLLEHLLVIHLVDVVAREDEDVIRLLAADRIDVLVDGVGGALIPVLRDAHLRRQHFDVIAVAHQRGPSAANVTIQAQRLVLRENENATQIAVQAIRKSDVDNAINAAERNRRLGAIAGKRPQALALAACQEHANRIVHQGHGCLSRTRYLHQASSSNCRSVLPERMSAPAWTSAYQCMTTRRRLLVRN